MKQIEREEGKAAYLQLYEQMREDIVAGLYGWGSKVPSKRGMAVAQGLSVITVEHAYELLCDEGYLEARQRSGYFVCFRAEAQYPVSSGWIAPQPHGERTQDFPFSVFARAMRRVISDYGENILNKSPNCGCDELRAAISRYLARSRGIVAAAEQIIVGAGAEYLYGLVVEMLGRNRIYAIEDPSYEKIEKVYLAREVECRRLPLGQDGIDRAALAACDATVLHITPYRSFPSGVTASASKRREYIRWAGQGERFIVEDDFASEFTVAHKPEETVFALRETGNVIYLNTFSQTISPSIRAGYMVLPREMLEIFRERVGFYSCTVPAFEQYVLAELIDRGEFERHINRVRRKKRKEMDERSGGN